MVGDQLVDGLTQKLPGISFTFLLRGPVPLGKVFVGAGQTLAHGDTIDVLLESIGKLLGQGTAAIEDADLRRDLAPIENLYLWHVRRPALGVEDGAEGTDVDAAAIYADGLGAERRHHHLDAVRSARGAQGVDHGGELDGSGPAVEGDHGAP